MNDTTKAAPFGLPAGGLLAWQKDGKTYLREDGVTTGPHDGTVEEVLRAAADRKGLPWPEGRR